MAFEFFRKKAQKRKQKEESGEEKKPLNRREHLRYPVSGFETELGKAIEISSRGIRLRKGFQGNLEKDLVKVRIGRDERECAVVWEDGENIGLRFSEPLDLKSFEGLFLKPREFEVEPVKRITEEQLLEFESSDRTRTVVNLMSELSDPNTNVDRFKVFIKELPELEEEILNIANSVEKAGKVKIKDIDLAVVRLGFETVKEIAGNFVKKKVSMANPQLSEFKHYEAFNILKGVLFKRLSPLFNFRDLRSEGSSLLATETTGATLLLKNGDESLKKHYTDPRHFYSFITRMLERAYFGKDLVDVNGTYLKKMLGMFEFLFDGYVLAHQTFNPMYAPPEDLKISLSSRKLKFAFISFMVFSALSFIMDRDRERGYSFISRLKRAGMDLGKAIEFTNNCIFEANDILYGIGLRRSLRPVSIPSFPFKVERFFPEDIHFGYFLLSFRRFARDTGRMVMRGDDEALMMLVLNRFLNVSEFNLNEKSFIVIPCANLKDDEIDPEVFSPFDIVIFKDVDRLDEELIDDFLKFWSDFDGKVVATVSTSSREGKICKKLREFIVDFPSYFLSDKVHSFMVELSRRFIESETGMKFSFDGGGEAVRMDSLILKWMRDTFRQEER